MVRPRSVLDRAYEEATHRQRFTERFRRSAATDRDQALELEWVAYCEREHWKGESLPDTSTRLMILRTLDDSDMKQNTAARLMRLSGRIVNYKLKSWGMQNKQGGSKQSQGVVK